MSIDILFERMLVSPISVIVATDRRRSIPHARRFWGSVIITSLKGLEVRWFEVQTIGGGLIRLGL